MAEFSIPSLFEEKSSLHFVINDDSSLKIYVDVVSYYIIFSSEKTNNLLTLLYSNIKNNPKESKEYINEKQGLYINEKQEIFKNENEIEDALRTRHISMIFICYYNTDILMLKYRYQYVTEEFCFSKTLFLSTLEKLQKNFIENEIQKDQYQIIIETF